MNALILGGNGYLGSKIIRKLAEEEIHQIVYTKRLTSDLSRIIDVEKKYSGSSIKSIPASTDAVMTAMQYIDFDIVLNMVCNYERVDTSTASIIEANTIFPLRILNCAAEKRIPRYITIGTGLPDEQNIYSYSKKQLSDFGLFFSSYYGISFYNIKLEMLYGSDEPANRFLPSLIRKMIRGEEVNVTEGTQHRDIIYVENVVEAIMMVIRSELSGYQNISVGTGIAPTISELVSFIWEETGRNSVVNKGAIPMRKNEPDCIGNPTVIKSLGCWEPIDWKDGIRKMIREIKEGGI